MTRLVEQNLEYTFDTGWTASKYDEWPFYRNHFESACAGNKAVDFIVIVQQKLEQRVRAIDPHPVVTEIGAAHSLPWSIRSIP